MKLDYLDLISPIPFSIAQTGSIRKHTLREISQLTGRVYSTYLALLNITPETYSTKVNPALKNWYENLSEDLLSSLTMYDIAVSSTAMQQSFSAILNFFFVEHVVYERSKDAFLLYSSAGGKPETSGAGISGSINKSNYSKICNIILKLNHIEIKEDVDLAKVKNKKGLARYMEMQKNKKLRPDAGKTDTDLELGNVISAVCTRHNCINYTNVWDMTIFQLWDAFARLRNNEVYESGKTSVSVWGDKENKFDFNLWYKNMR